ncbi:MAG TPA: hypothetical protein VIU61_28440, partial [Kofleriaceae bacterium]
MVIAPQSLDHQAFLDATDASSREEDLRHAAARKRPKELVTTERRHLGNRTRIDRTARRPDDFTVRARLL